MTPAGGSLTMSLASRIASASAGRGFASAAALLRICWRVSSRTAAASILRLAISPGNSLGSAASRRWRVLFYALSALGTDKYPPFSLRSNSEYPADLEVDYPERLHRGLVLIKWWLLAIPHYLVLVAFFDGGVGAFMGNDDDDWGDGTILVPLIRVLLLIAVVALLFTARYPKGLYDFVIGINRWAIRVLAYTSLMRDEYPPFRCVLNAEGSVRCRQCFLKWCCAGDEGLLALRSRPAGGGFKPPHAAGAVTRLW